MKSRVIYWTCERVKRFRLAIGYTQERFARLLNITQSHLSQWEHDRHWISKPYQDKLNHHFRYFERRGLVDFNLLEEKSYDRTTETGLARI